MLKSAVAAFALIAAVPALAQAGPAEEAALTAVIKDYEAFARADDPLEAGQDGDREALTRLPDITPAAEARRKTTLTALKARLSAVPAAQLSGDSRLNRDFLAWTIDRRLTGIDFDDNRFAFSSDGGFDTLTSYLPRSVTIKTADDARAYIARLAAVPKLYADGMDNARRGMNSGWTQPRSTVEAVILRAETRAAGPIETDPLLSPLDSLPAAIPAAEQAALKAQALKVAREQIRPAQTRFVAFLKDEYLPKARPGLGVGSIPGGRDYYAWLARDFTTTAMTPDEIHEVGKKEVARIRAEMDGVMQETGFKGTFPEFLAFLRKDPRFYATTREDLLEKASEISKRIDDKLPAYFGTLPRLSYGVRPVPREIEEGYTTGRYFPGNLKQGIAGGYMVNTSHLDQRPLYELPSLTLHEAVPGHHLQIALSQELEDVPAFRRNAGVTAFTEGWGLYSEKLGVEMGIYRDAYEQFGRLSYEMWRACRLVADTGIHWKGWSLDQAKACFYENSALAPKNIEVEVARYVSWPGQALGYKVGEIKLVELRKKAEAALGGKFDVRRYHDAVLLAGPLPLQMLEAKIDAWIAAEKARP